MITTKRSYIVRNPEAFFEKQRSAAAKAALLRRLNAVPNDVRFWRSVQKSDGCWEWQGYIHSHGYGIFTWWLDKQSKRWRAHRFAWTITNGLIPVGQQVLHSCDNRRCVRPEHLFLGTQKENMQDAKRKGRAYQPGQHCAQGPDGRWVAKSETA